MTISIRWTAAAALLAAAACQNGESATSAPWLTYPGIDGHARYLPLAGTSHDPSAPGTTVTCAGCHTNPATFHATPANPINCTGICHTQAVVAPLHSPGSGFTFGDQACLDCHRTGIAAPADHDTRFFPRSPAHAGIRCSECHTDLASPNDPHNYHCASCHQTSPATSLPPHNPVNIPDGLGVLQVDILTVHTSENTLGPSVSLTTSDTCLRCHADSQVDRIADHPTGSEAFSRSAHSEAGCATCHVTSRTDKPFAINFAAARTATRASPGCIICHAGGGGG